MLEKQQKKIRRHKKIRARLKGTMRIPRLCVFRSAKHIYCQLIDDEKSIILAVAQDQEFKKSPHARAAVKGGKEDKSSLTRKEISTSHKKPKPSISTSTIFNSPPRAAVEVVLLGKEEKTDRTGKIGIAFEVGKLIAKKASEKKIDKIIFDRGGYKYHGRIKSLAEGAREGGLKF